MNYFKTLWKICAGMEFFASHMFTCCSGGVRAHLDDLWTAFASCTAAGKKLEIPSPARSRDFREPQNP